LFPVVTYYRFFPLLFKGMFQNVKPFFRTVVFSLMDMPRFPVFSLIARAFCFLKEFSFPV